MQIKAPINLLPLVVFTFLTGLVSSNPMPLPEPEQSYRYPGSKIKHNKDEIPDAKKISSFDCVYHCVRQTSDFMDIEVLTMHEFCHKKFLKSETWFDYHFNPCLYDMCDHKFEWQIVEEINFWYADFCDYPFGRK